jgi:hypothetical protein
MIDATTGNALLDLIEAGDEFEMPRGVARRMVAAGWTHPEGDSEERFTKVLTAVVLMDGIGEDNVNSVGAAALAADGATR